VKDLIPISKAGFKYTTADNISRWLFPIILILSADYEEQYVFLFIFLLMMLISFFRCIMALIRGVNSKFPCPVCLAPGDQLCNISTQFEFRTSQAMREIFEETEGMNAKDTDDLLKKYGLHNVKVS